MANVVDIDDDEFSLDTTIQVYDVHHGLSQAGWMGQQQETTSTVPQETMGTEAAASSSTAATPPQYSDPPSWNGCPRSKYCVRTCTNGKHDRPGACKLIEPPADYVVPPGSATYAQDFARINGNRGKKRKGEEVASPEGRPRVAPAPFEAASAQVTMASLAPQQPAQTRVGRIVKYRALNGEKCAARVVLEFKQDGVEMLLVIPMDLTTGKDGGSIRIYKSAVVGDAGVMWTADSDEEQEPTPVAASEKEDASDTTGSDEGEQQSVPPALGAFLNRECQRLTAENLHLTSRLDAMEKELKEFKERLVAAIFPA